MYLSGAAPQWTALPVRVAHEQKKKNRMQSRESVQTGTQRSLQDHRMKSLFAKVIFRVQSPLAGSDWESKIRAVCLAVSLRYGDVNKNRMRGWGVGVIYGKLPPTTPSETLGSHSSDNAFNSSRTCHNRPREGKRRLAFLWRRMTI